MSGSRTGINGVRCYQLGLVGYSLCLERGDRVSPEAVPEDFVRRIGIFGCDGVEARVGCHNAALELFLGEAASQDEHVDVLIMLSD